MDDSLAGTREAVRHAAEVIRQAREVQVRSRAPGDELRREVLRLDLVRERRPDPSPEDKPPLH